MKNIKLVIFDLDGTLVDAYPAINSSFNYAMRAFGRPAQREAVIRKAVGWGDEELLRPFIGADKLKAALFVYRRHHMKSLAKGARLLPGVKRLLERLKSKGYKLAVASNRPTKFSLLLIRHLGLKKYFDFVLCADKLKKGKPHPEILQMIMRKFSVSPKQAVYAGDMAIDAQAARAAKIRAIIVTGGSSSLSQIKLQKPYRIIRKIAQLSGVLY